MIRAAKKLVRLKPREEILYCKSGGDNTTFFLEDQTKLIAPGHLGLWEKALTEFEFLRIHRSYLLNLAFFRSLENDEKDGRVILLNGVSLKLSRVYKTTLLKHIELK